MQQYLLLPSLASTEHLGKAGCFGVCLVSWASNGFLDRGSSNLGGADLTLLFLADTYFSKAECWCELFK